MYVDKEGKKVECVMIHRAILGSLERFFGIMTEHYAGKFPLWLNPEQVRILPIADRHLGYAKEVLKELNEVGVRASIDEKALTTSKKVFEAETAHVNYILVVGDKEVTNKTVNVRTRDNEVKGEIAVSEFAAELIEEINSKK
jgi:threonyl-tRNA synthetase